MSKMLGAILGVVVGIIVLGGALMPIIDDSAADTSTLTNKDNALYEMTYIDENTDYSLIWETNNPTYVSVNGDEVQLRSGTILCAVNDWIFRFGSSSNGYYLQPISTSFDGSINAGLNPDVTVNIAVSGGTLSYQIIGGEYSDEIKTESITEGYGIVANGNGTHIMKDPNDSAFVLADSRIVGMGVTTVDGVWNVGFSATGTVSDLNILQYSGSTVYAIGDETITYEPVSGYSDLYSIQKYEFDVTNPTTSNVTHITYSYFIVPIDVVAEKAEGAPLSDYKGIIFTIPIVIIVALLIMVVGRRY